MSSLTPYRCEEELVCCKPDEHVRVPTSLSCHFSYFRAKYFFEFTGSILCICLGLEKSLGFPMPRSVYFSVPVPATGGRDNPEAYTSNDGSPPPGTVLREVLAMPCRLGGLGLVSPMTLCAQYESSVAITASLSRRIVDRVSDIGNSLIGI